MPWFHRITIRSIALAACSIAFSIQTAQAKPRSQAQGLFVAGENELYEFQGSELETTGTASTNLFFGTENYLDPLSMTLDQNDNLWVTELSNLPGGDVAILEITRTAVDSVKSGKSAKDRLILPSGPGVKNVGWLGLGFDAKGDLWISSAVGELLMLRSSQLKRKHPSPKIVISSMGWSPGVLRFDSSDNLWVAAADGQIWRFSPSDRAASGPPDPGLKLTLPDGLVPIDFAFDRSGNMWIAGGDIIEEISAADLTGTGETSPSTGLTITSSAFGTGSCLGGLDFDNSGNLWVSVIGTLSGNGCVADSQVVKFAPSQLSTGGGQDPSVAIGLPSPAFSPAPLRFGRAIK
jgi:hypothetical protein